MRIKVLIGTSLLSLCICLQAFAMDPAPDDNNWGLHIISPHKRTRSNISETPLAQSTPEASPTLTFQEAAYYNAAMDFADSALSLENYFRSPKKPRISPEKIKPQSAQKAENSSFQPRNLSFGSCSAALSFIEPTTGVYTATLAFDPIFVHNRILSLLLAMEVKKQAEEKKRSEANLDFVSCLIKANMNLRLSIAALDVLEKRLQELPADSESVLTFSQVLSDLADKTYQEGLKVVKFRRENESKIFLLPPETLQAISNFDVAQTELFDKIISSFKKTLSRLAH